MPTVYPATPFNASDMGSLGNASNMLYRQHNFPNDYDERDSYCFADHDRILNQGRKRAEDCIKRHTGSGEMAIGDWVKRAMPANVLAFLAELLEADREVTWTGFRVMGTVHRGNGFPVWTLELFAKHPETRTVVYTGQKAPNIQFPPCR